MNLKNELLNNIDKIHTTKLGIERIKKNLNLECDNVVKWCQNTIQTTNNSVIRKGKNYYINFNDFTITINAYSFTIITAHKRNKHENNNNI